MTAASRGISHLGLTVTDAIEAIAVFVDVVGWRRTGLGQDSPKNPVTDGQAWLTLWSVRRGRAFREFDRQSAVGLYPLALEIVTEAVVSAFGACVAAWPGSIVAFQPEPVGTAPRKQAMSRFAGALRIELTSLTLN